MIGVARYKQDNSCLEKLFKNNEFLTDLDKMKNPTIKNEYKNPQRVG